MTYSNNYNNSNCNNDKLFFQVWRNKYILNQFIFYHLRLFNLLVNVKRSISYAEIDTYKSKFPLIYYTKSVRLFGVHNDMDNVVRFIESLPENVISITFEDYTFRQEFNQPCLGEHIKSFTISTQTDKGIALDCIPVSLESLKMGQHYDRNNFSLPIGSNLTYLNTGFSYDYPIKSGILPNTLKHLVLGHQFNSKLQDKVLPPNLSILEFGNSYDHVIDSNIFQDTSSLQVLKFGDSYNNSLSSLNKLINLRKLYLGKEFNRVIEEGDLPNKLLSLKFKLYDGIFNQELKVGSLPESIEKITFSLRFNQDVHKDNYGSLLPPKLRVIKFGEQFSRLIPNGVLPNSIVKLYFDTENQTLPLTQYSLPTSITKLQISGRQDISQLNSLPTSLKTIKGVTITHIPHLSSIVDDHQQQFKLKLGYFFNAALELGNQVPISRFITSLSLGYSFNSPISLANTQIRHLKFGHCYDLPLAVDSLPAKYLESLEFGFNYNRPLNIELMKQLTNLKVLSFGARYKIEIPPNLLPNSITYLSFAQGYEKPISIDWLPTSIKRITALSECIPINLPLPLDQIECITINKNNFKVFNDYSLVLNIFKYLKTK